MSNNKENRQVEAISGFLKNACRIRPSYRLSFVNFFRRVSYPITRPDGVKCKLFPVSTGSIAELYIEPMLSCIGDADFMYHFSSELAIPQWHPPPTQLPTDFENRVKVYEIVDSHVPGYAYLSLTYILSRDMHTGNYIIAEYVSSANATLNTELHLFDDCEAEIHGPAYMLVKHSIPYLFRGLGIMIDTVPCVHCFVWPPQAADWLKRDRGNGWPDSVTVDGVVSNGCDLVGVAHRHCREDEWMSKHQWRLSFSRAEVVLLNSWTPEQQIVYHMLRVFAKTELLTANTVNCGADTLSNYHVKTLMLWACEVKPQHWWNDGSTLVRKCLYLLWFLEEWLTKMHGQHYFIDSIHFCDYFDKFYTDSTTAMVRSFTEEYLANWFVDSYIRNCAKLCPHTVSMSCNDLVISEISEDILSTIMQWRDHLCDSSVVKHSLPFILLHFLSWLNCFHLTSFQSQSIDLYQPFSPIALSLPQVDEHALPALFHMIMTSNYSFPSKHRMLFYDNIAHIMCGLCTSAGEKCKLQCFSLESSKLNDMSHFQRAVTLMKLVAKKHRNTRELLLIELSKSSLWRALQCNKPKSDSDQCLALLYLSVLFYTTGQYQMAMYHLILATNLQGESQCGEHSSHVVEGKLLPKMDKSIDCALGLVVFYQYILTVVFNKHQTEQVGVFTLELFSHYFTIKHLLVAKSRHCTSKARDKEITQTVQCYLNEELKSCVSTVLSSEHLFTSDIMLCKLSSISRHRGRNKNVTVTQNSTSAIKRRQIADLMTELSLQQLLTYRHLLISPRDTEHRSNRFDFMALYLYRCQLYELCEQLCRQKICNLIGTNSCDVPRISIVYHEFIELMDDDAVSAIGLALLLHKANYWFREPVTITQLTLSLYLLTKCQFCVPYCIYRVSRQFDLDTVAVILDWIVNAQMTPTSIVDYLMLKLAERNVVMHLTSQLSGADTAFCNRPTGECVLGITVDGLHGIKVELSNASMDDTLIIQFKSGDNTAWICSAVEKAQSVHSVVKFSRSRNEQNTDTIKESLQKKVQTHIRTSLPIRFLQRCGSGWNSSYPLMVPFKAYM